MSRYRLSVSKGLLCLIIVTYCILGLTYAVETPKWQVPDEPAHYNYILYIVDNCRFPVLQMGDYPHQYLEEIKAAGFPPHMSVAPLRYESHQPPLYYFLAAALYTATGFLGFEGQFLILRLLSVVLGCLFLLVAYAVAKEIFPDEEFLALATTSLIATVPMHIAMSAAINNDTLAELILVLILWLCVKSLKAGLTQRQVLLLGFLLALALLTKTTIYALTVLSIVLALGVRARVDGMREFIRQLGFISGLALLSCWWFLRNLLTYGDLDFFGWQRHDSIVIGQPTTAQWIGEYGLSKVIRDFFITSFHSFWAQFGWMGVLVDSRLYMVLAVISIIVVLGLILFLTRIARNRLLLTFFQWSALGLLLMIFVVTTAEHVSYNLKFVQHQGRYLFPGLISIGLAFALGLREWVSIVARRLSRLPPLAPFVSELNSIGKGLVLFLLYGGFLALDVVCLYVFIVPYFQA